MGELGWSETGLPAVDKPVTAQDRKMCGLSTSKTTAGPNMRSRAAMQGKALDGKAASFHCRRGTRAQPAAKGCSRPASSNDGGAGRLGAFLLVQRIALLRVLLAHPRVQRVRVALWGKHATANVVDHLALFLLLCLQVGDPEARPADRAEDREGQHRDADGEAEDLRVRRARLPGRRNLLDGQVLQRRQLGPRHHRCREEADGGSSAGDGGGREEGPCR
mmetsp:Transcript_133782/g.346338  ORF Transcript_133782/g.346338 Transcript_133782/m.346338 type:complete len:219 (+) Transcript_133782:195-851(+)